MPLSTQHSRLSDEELLQAYRRTGDNTWLGYLLQRYTVLLLGVAMKYLRDKEAAHDAVQHVFLKSLTSLPEGEIGNFKGWLYVLVRNHCLGQLRNKVYLAGEEALYIVAAEGGDIEAMQQKEASFAEMEEALTQLNADQRRCVEAFYLHQKSYNDIMEATGFSFVQVKSYIQNGKRNLKIILTRNSSQRQ